jgi:hypothetical protein
MSEQDTTNLILNATAIGLTLAQVETILTISVLIVSFGYTAQRWYLQNKNKNNNKNV